jgi:hypothetical protein
MHPGAAEADGLCPTPALCSTAIRDIACRTGLKLADHVILVFGHTRPEALQFVLEGLRRQNALADTQVWLDGHQEFPELLPRVQACQAVETLYPEAEWIKYGSNCGFSKLFIDAVLRNCPRFKFIIVLQDDCFPAPGAIEAMLQTLIEVDRSPELFSAYGHHFGAANEAAETTAFQCWGWGSPSEKLRPIVIEFARIWSMPEPDAVAWFRDQLTPEIRKRMDVYPGRSESMLLERRFCFDAVIAFLTAKQGMRHKKTTSHVIHNFGMGQRAGHFPGFHDFYLKPPFNMTTRSSLIERFGLHGLPDTDQFLIMSGNLPETAAPATESGPRKWGLQRMPRPALLKGAVRMLRRLSGLAQT